MSTRKNRKKQAELIAFDKDAEEENEESVFHAKIHEPIVWGNFPSGFVIKDLPVSRYEEVSDFIKENFLTNDLLCKNTNILDDYDSITDLVTTNMSILRDKCSICAIEEETQRLAGVLILRVLNKGDYRRVFSRIKVVQGEAYQKIRKAFDFLNRKSDLFTIFNCDGYLRCYLLAVHDDFRRKGIGLQLLRAAADVARSLNTPIIMGIFATGCLQKKARKIGMETVNEIYYVDWVEKGEIIFSDPGAGNYTLSLMAGKVFPETT